MKQGKITVLLGGIFLFLLFAGAGCSSREVPRISKPDGSVAPSESTPKDFGNEPAAPPADVDTPLGDGPDTGDSSDIPDGWQVYEGDGFTLQYPDNWRVSEIGGLYRIPEGKGDDFQVSEEFDYGIREQLATLYVISEENLNNIDLEQLWEEVNVDWTIKEQISLGGNPALTASCGGISYSECVATIYKGKKFIVYIDYMVDNEFVREEVRQILATFSFTN